MREIEFRGKRRFDEEWVYGDLVHGNEHHPKDLLIRPIEVVAGYPVRRDTAGQYTGLKDRNGVKIFEGDIVNYSEPGFLTAQVCYGLYDVNDEHCAASDNFGWFLKTILLLKRKTAYPGQHVYCIDGKAAFWPKHCADTPAGIEKYILEVIGNIHDNPELLEAEK